MNCEHIEGTVRTLEDPGPLSQDYYITTRSFYSCPAKSCQPSYLYLFTVPSNDPISPCVC